MLFVSLDPLNERKKMDYVTLTEVVFVCLRFDIKAGCDIKEHGEG